jgi:hypothetical protein
MTGYKFHLAIEQHGAAFAIVRLYRDGLRIVEGVYSARRDAVAELALIREAEAV